MQKNNISNSVIRRLPRYYRFLGELLKQGIAKISSRELSEMMRLTASQIRQDLNCFGGFGQQGYGYNVAELRGEIAKILGLDITDKVILIGAGNLGRALTMHIDFDKYGYELVGIFDSNIAMENIEISGIQIQHISRLAEFCGEHSPKMAVLCIPPEGAKEIVEKLISMGITAFWNFSHYDIHYDFPDVIVENVHLTDSLMTLSYAAKRSDGGFGVTED
ncbi:MAG: redox-sensing transcriptional repressor Rex [Oscillospiraceae bacterium]|nr:redox-sensing transcriptional repressor Rex [Oscillospiraceae bacterium]